MNSLILHVALPVPVRHLFDYLAGDGRTEGSLKPGMRVLVPFGRRKQCVGMIAAASRSSDVDPRRLKPVLKILDVEPLFGEEHFQLLHWASDYYHYPLGEVIFSTLPRFLRLGKAGTPDVNHAWRITEQGKTALPDLPARAKRQAAILNLLGEQDRGLTGQELNLTLKDWRGPMKALVNRGWVETITAAPGNPAGEVPAVTVSLNDEQQSALAVIRAGLGSNSRILLDGVTGSGKTEVYLETIKLVIKEGKQALVLVPEIGLTPHFISRFRERLQSRLVVLHSGLSDGERLQAWVQAREGTAAVILGTRSAVWTPLASPGLIIIDEEHDASYKQQDGFRYSARDIALLRGDKLNIPVILGSATPSLESLNNVHAGKINRVTLSKRAEDALLPAFQLIDLRGRNIPGAISRPLETAIAGVLEQGKQVLLFLNRRGYSPVLMCHDCGWISTCTRCDIPLTFHKHPHGLLCHHCGARAVSPGACPECRGDEIVQIGHGTERLTETLREKFPGARVLRIDRDTTRRKGSMQAFMDRIHSGEADILVGTQMLAKGHHFPAVTLVGILDADRGLYSADFRASERMAQLITQVSGRAGRARDPGLVMIQTHFPDHPFLRTLIKQDYHTFSRILMEERKSACLPPYSYQAMLRAEAYEEKSPVAFLERARALLDGRGRQVEVFGPFPAPFEKRAGRYRFQLLLQANDRIHLQKGLRNWMPDLESSKEGKKIRWSLDVDPQEIL